MFFLLFHLLLSRASPVAATNLISISPCIPIFNAAIYMFHLNALRPTERNVKEFFSSFISIVSHLSHPHFNTISSGSFV